MATYIPSPDSQSPDKATSILTQLRNIKDIISRYNALRVDATEYACLKALVLFKAGKIYIFLFCFALDQCFMSR